MKESIDDFCLELEELARSMRLDAQKFDKSHSYYASVKIRKVCQDIRKKANELRKILLQRRRATPKKWRTQRKDYQREDW